MFLLPTMRKLFTIYTSNPTAQGIFYSKTRPAQNISQEDKVKPTMSGNVLFFLAAMLLFGLITAIPELKKVPNAHLQCQQRSTAEQSYNGSCALKIRNGKYPSICKNLVCARALPETGANGKYGAYSTGPAQEGTRCGHSSICHHGKCEDLRGGPIEYGPIRKYYCIVPTETTTKKPTN